MSQKVGAKFWDKSPFLESLMLLPAQYETVSEPDESGIPGP